MSLIIHAPNVHQGGGRSLLVPLLMAAGEIGCTAILDERLHLPQSLPVGLSVTRVRPTLLGRLLAELNLRRIGGVSDDVLCFGNLPPLFATRARVHVFIQNCYLVFGHSLRAFPWRTRLRITVERAWLRVLLRAADVIVQTPSMGYGAREVLGASVRVMPFAAEYPERPSKDDIHDAPRSCGRKFDFVYVASGEPHKNHRTLVDAWCLLADDGLRPSLCLTLDASREQDLLSWIEERKLRFQLAIYNAGSISPIDVAELYETSGALVYPSYFESFGLPLIEARRASLPVLASELDYVRDVVVPDQTFDPNSPISIARAVRRFMSVPDVSPEVLTPEEFISRLYECE